jgi:hypothetical protein
MVEQWRVEKARRELQRRAFSCLMFAPTPLLSGPGDGHSMIFTADVNYRAKPIGLLPPKEQRYKPSPTTVSLLNSIAHGAVLSCKRLSEPRKYTGGEVWIRTANGHKQDVYLGDRDIS